MRYLPTILACLWLLQAPVCDSLLAAEPKAAPKIRLATYNVQFGKMASPEAVGQMFKKYDLDVIGFCEVPAGDWTSRVGKVLGLKHAYVGKLSSLNYKDKYKSILSRARLANPREIPLLPRGSGWSVVAAQTEIRGVPLSVYSLHTGGRSEGHQKHLAEKVLPKDAAANIIMMGDFNAVLGQRRRKRWNGLMDPLTKFGMKATWRDLGIDVDKHFTLSALEPTTSLRNYGVIDHILIGPKSRLRPVRGGIIELAKPLSDHKPVWVELELGDR